MNFWPGHARSHPISEVIGPACTVELCAPALCKSASLTCSTVVSVVCQGASPLATAAGRRRACYCCTSMSGSVLARIFLLLVTLVYGAVPSAAEAELCDAPCRSAQRAALLQLFSATNPSGWNNSDGWGGSQAASVPDLPAHCGWFGVACCIDGELDLRFFPSTVVVNCSASAGVTAILLYRNNLTGPITGVNWAAFATSLRYLDLAGGVSVAVRCPGCLLRAQSKSLTHRHPCPYLSSRAAAAPSCGFTSRSPPLCTQEML